MDRMAFYELVLFDADGTLLDFKKSEEMAFYATFAQMGSDDGSEIENAYRYYQLINDRYWKMFEEGKITKNKLVIKRFEELFQQMNSKMDAAVFNACYLDNLGMGGFLMPGALETVRALQQKCRMAIITNGVALTQHNRIRASGLIPYLNGVFVSEEIGYNKPDTKFFDAVLQKCGQKDRNRTLVVGDSLQADILGGVNAGIATCWLNTKQEKAPENLKIDFEIANLKEAVKIILDGKKG